MRPGAYLVDRLPWLKYVPGYGRRLREYYKSDLEFYKGKLKCVERAMVNAPSLILKHVNVANKNA